MRTITVISQPTVEELLSQVNAKLADILELLRSSGNLIGHSCSVLTELGKEIESIYLMLDSECGPESDRREPEPE